MTEYEFTLKFAIPDDLAADELEASLFEHGCNDALIGIGQKGRLALSVTRHAATAHKAVSSAINNVQQAIPEARLIEVSPDLVGISDIAEQLDFSRQNMRKLWQTHINTFPLPVHEGHSALWHLAEVLEWFSQHQHKAIDEAVRDLASVSMQINIGREAKRLEAHRHPTRQRTA